MSGTVRTARSTLCSSFAALSVENDFSLEILQAFREPQFPLSIQYHVHTAFAAEESNGTANKRESIIDVLCRNAAVVSRFIFMT